MKNIIIAIAVIAIAALIYTQMRPGGETSNQAATSTQAAPTASASASAVPAPDTSTLISEAPEGADVFFISPGDGATVSSPVKVEFGLTNVALVPAGDTTEHSGHHHILIDVDELPDMTLPIPATDNMVHYGLAQNEAMLELAPGEHTLQLLVGNYLHIPHDPPIISKKITITVE